MFEFGALVTPSVFQELVEEPEALELKLAPVFFIAHKISFPGIGFIAKDFIEPSQLFNKKLGVLDGYPSSLTLNNQHGRRDVFDVMDGRELLVERFVPFDRAEFILIHLDIIIGIFLPDASEPVRKAG